MIEDMFAMAPGWGWLLLSYTVGTVFGMKMRFDKVIGTTIDSLIDNGFLRTRTNEKGEVEILKLKDE
jgi:hypothetical protein